MVDLACLMSDITSVTLYDTLGDDSTAYIVNQCELKTIFCTADKISQLASLMPKMKSLKNLVLMDSGTVYDVDEGV